MPLLFSYGTLQQHDVQRATFGRVLHGEIDELPGFELSAVPIDDAEVIAATGATHYANVVENGQPASRVRGTAFAITDAELAAADDYEAPAAYSRILVSLVSGRRAWVYRRPSARP